MEQLELEGIAEAILREAGQADDEPPKLARLVVSLLGEGSVEYSPLRLAGDGALVRIHDEWRIYIKRGIPLERRAFAISHEIAEWWLRVRERYMAPDVEDAANYIAAAVMTPRRAFRRAMRAHQRDFGEVANGFRTTETHVALREAELNGQPRVVVSPALVRIRGPETWVWPREVIIRGWAKATHEVPGLKKVRLTDDPRRVVLDVDEPDVG